MNEFIVFGNPINHTKSPEIHRLFSKSIGVDYSYGKKLVLKNKFEKVIKKFFLSNGLGANVTIPFKERAFLLCDNCTDYAMLVKSVNVIKKQVDGTLFGDNTDGIGLLNDLQRLRYINKNINILFIGAGGVARGVIPCLLRFGCNVFIVNRTLSRAYNLVSEYNHIGNIKVITFNNLNDFNCDLIINSIPIKYDKNNFFITSKAFSGCFNFYDILYNLKGDTSFISLCRYYYEKRNFSDGLGMLIEQAAYSCFFWHGIFPPTSYVIKKIKLI